MDEPGEWSVSANRDGTVELDWPSGRPETVLIPADMLEAWVAQRNRMVAMETLITIWRLNRRPSQADWAACDLPPIDPQVKIDLMARKPRVPE